MVAMGVVVEQWLQGMGVVVEQWLQTMGNGCGCKTMGCNGCVVVEQWLQWVWL